jgi:hypothetical protein
VIYYGYLAAKISRSKVSISAVTSAFQTQLLWTAK